MHGCTFITREKQEGFRKKQMQEVTIVIPNYNGKKLLLNCLKTLERQTVKDFKVLVIDNASTDGSSAVTSSVLDMEMVILQENLGFCGAVNIGIQKTKTPYILLLNNDTEADEHFVEALLCGIRQSEHIFSCGAQMIDFKNREVLDNAGDLYTAMGWAVARGKGKTCGRFSKPEKVFSCCAGAAIYRMEILKKIGGLDERHFAYLEDVDLGYRARIAGYENRYEPAAKVYHVGSATTGTRYNEKKVFLAARNTIFVVYKNMPFFQLIINAPLILLGMVIKTLFFIRKGFAKEYLKGIAEGIAQCRKCSKVPFAFENITHYVKIQLELWYNIVRIM